MRLQKFRTVLTFLVLFTCINLSGKEIYFFTNDIPGIVGKIRIYEEDKKLTEIGNNQCLVVQVGNVSEMSLIFKWGLRLNKKVEINFSDKEVVFIYIHLDPVEWLVYESYYPNIPSYVKNLYDQKKNKENTAIRVQTHPNTGYTKISFKEYLNDPKTAIEGIYENAIETDNFPKYEIGIFKTELGYTLIYLGGGDKSIWKEGDVKAYLTETANSNLFKVKWFKGNKEVTESLYISFDYTSMNVVWTDGSQEQIYLKLFPLSKNGGSNILSSGSGFALSSDGLIVTNYHVIEGATSIMVKGINSDFSKSYSAKVLVSDKNNDLAIIQISDSSFTNLGKIPYMLKEATSDVGEDIYVLGYPLRATMGDEIKLTNGIISSKTGFQGDVTAYQVSAPVQPGNSGGPLFDTKGNLVGIINAKHLGAENASYAIKVSYLKNLIELLPQNPSLNKTNSLANLSLSDQVKKLNRFVYIIEIH